MARRTSGSSSKVGSGVVKGFNMIAVRNSAYDYSYARIDYAWISDRVIACTFSACLVQPLHLHVLQKCLCC